MAPLTLTPLVRAQQLEDRPAGQRHPAPGWYADPLGGGRARKWDGSSWTPDTAPTSPAQAQATRLTVAVVLGCVALVTASVLVALVDASGLRGAQPGDGQVAAARACASFRRFMDAYSADPDPNHPGPVRLALSPSYAGLAADIDRAEGAALAHDPAVLLEAGSAAVARCATLRPAAKRTGGFIR